ncbi:hypothetical protein SAY86_000514 [Trapa natans]|uniref:Polysaccharide biosynthesis domain-containing protein n=1 Tax=Trapa natans TaxID=22666 RepID=A0AAN7MYH0_TRANT|nr:hypothetical protein SAY86_000514 [Trapa natans]
MKGATNTKLILFHPQLHKQPASRIWLLLFSFTFFTLAFFTFTLITTAVHPSSSAPSFASAVPMSPYVRDALLHYAAAAANSTSGGRLSAAELAAVSATIRRCVVTGTGAGCNLLVFGLTHETLLYRALNSNGRTVFLDEREFLISRVEQQHPGIEAYDVQYTTKVVELTELLRSARQNSRGDCRPVQNLLFSECRLGLNDLPNHIYQIDWDVILIDGPAGYSPTAPGRMSAIFTAAVLARSKKADGGGNSKTHILVHDLDREVEKLCSEEYLCSENLVEAVDRLGHFVVDRMGRGQPETSNFCSNLSSPSL